MQDIFDKLYDKSKRGRIFTNLMELINMESNIRLAYRNIKTNTGSKTKGTDNLTIKDISELNINEFINDIQVKLKKLQSSRS